jgi:hypothetical protein
VLSLPVSDTRYISPEGRGLLCLHQSLLQMRPVQEAPQFCAPAAVWLISVALTKLSFVTRIDLPGMLLPNGWTVRLDTRPLCLMFFYPPD